LNDHIRTLLRESLKWNC